MNFPPAVGFDLETAGTKQEYALQPCRFKTNEGWITAASTNVVGFLNPTFYQLHDLVAEAVNSDHYLVGWNVSFDAAWLIAAGLEDLVFKAKWLDAMLLWRHAVVEPEGDDVPFNKRKSYSLESAMKEFYPEHADFKEFDDFQATDEQSLEQLLHRNKMDALWTLRLAERFWSALNDAQRQAALIEARCIPLVAKTKTDGIVASRAAAQTLFDNLTKETLNLYRGILAVAPEVRGLNLKSSPQLQKLIYETWGLPATRFSKKTKNPSTDKYALFDLAALDPRTATLKKLRESKNNRVKYAVGTLKSLEYNDDGRVRPQAKIFSTYTSRITYGSSDKATIEVEKTTKKHGTVMTTKKTTVPVGISLHQWRRGKDYRSIIQPPEGYTLCEFDFAGQEFRWMAVASGDETMLSLCAPGEDAHSYMGAQVAQCNYQKLILEARSGNDAAVNDRKCGKFCNLSYQYRIGYKAATTKARVDFGMDVDEMFIRSTMGTYKAAYPGVAQYWQRQINNCKVRGYAETFAGRRVQLKRSWAGRDAWGMESTAINYPIQGTGGDQKYLALAVLRNLMPKYSAYFYYELHDGVFTIVPTKYLHPFCVETEKALSNLPYKAAWGVDLPIKFPVDTMVGPSWGDLKEFSP